MIEKQINFDKKDLNEDFPISFAKQIFQGGPYTAVPHIHNIFEMGYCHKGQGEFLVSDKILPFRTGDVIVINRLEPHIAHNSKGIESEWTWIYFDVVKLLTHYCENSALLNTDVFVGPEFKNILTAKEYPQINALILQILHEEANKKDFYQEAIRGKLVSVLAQLRRMPGIKDNIKSYKEKIGLSRLKPAIKHIHGNYSEKIKLRDLAKTCHMSESNFCALFKKVYSKPAYQYVLAYRISMASVDLTEGIKTLETTAIDNGFPTLSSFVRKFKKEMKAPPRQWIVEHLQDQSMIQ